MPWENSGQSRRLQGHHSLQDTEETKGKQWASTIKKKILGSGGEIFEHHRKILSEENLTDSMKRSRIATRRHTPNLQKKKFQIHLRKMYRTVVGVVAAAKMAAAKNI